jgi:hypothetical protein
MLGRVASAAIFGVGLIFLIWVALETNLDKLTLTKAQEPPPAQPVDLLIDKLGSKVQEERENAQTNLLKLVDRNPSVRDYSVKKLEDRVASQQTAVIACAEGCYEGWKLAVDTIRKLEATESIDLLVGKVGFNDGAFGYSLVWFPVAQALVGFGDAAVPNIETALSQSDDELNSLLYIEVLRSIGTPLAKSALERVRHNATNKFKKENVDRVMENWVYKD